MNKILELKREIIKLAIKEIEKLKKNLRPIESKRLDYSVFDPESPSNCIYGLATGNCDTTRAKRLIRLCTPKILSTPQGQLEFRNVKDHHLSALPYHMNRDHRSDVGDIMHWSPLEIVIATPSLKKYTKNTIAFIRGETNELKLKEVLK